MEASQVADSISSLLKYQGKELLLLVIINHFETAMANSVRCYYEIKTGSLNHWFPKL